MAAGDNLAERLKQAEAELRERKLGLQLIVDGIPTQVAVIAPNGEVETLNQPCLEYFGKTLDELKGWSSSDSIHPEDLPRVIEVLQHALETGEAYEVKSRHRFVVAGMLNKQIGLRLGMSEITVKAQRGKMMQKMKAGAVADLVKTAMKPGLAPARNPWPPTESGKHHDSIES